MADTVLRTRSDIRLHPGGPCQRSRVGTNADQRKASIVYANPCDATNMIRKQGYVPFAQPTQRYDEVVVANSAESAFNRLEDLKPGRRIAVTQYHDVELIGLRQLEPADLNESLIEWVSVDSYQAAARKAIKEEVVAVFFLADAFATLTRLTRSQLRALVANAISDIPHVLLVISQADIDLFAIKMIFSVLIRVQLTRICCFHLGGPKVSRR